MYDEGYNMRRSAFEQSYRCYPVSFIEKPHLEKGDKIIMPPSALDRLAYLQIDYPMLFEINNPSAGRVSHCGVLEFIADEGLIYLPYWMMENMLLQPGDIVHVKNASLSKGTFVKLQPHTKDFIDLSNPKAVFVVCFSTHLSLSNNPLDCFIFGYFIDFFAFCSLETTLRNYSCLTTGDTIMVAYNNKRYYIDIVETKPSYAISIIETDCEVDFAPPLDYKEPEKPAPSTLSNKKPPEVQEDEPAKKIAKFSAFTGSARRLDGKPSVQSVAPVSSPMLKQHQPMSTNGTNGSGSASSSRQHRGKLVFGSNVDQAPNGTPKATPKESSQELSQQAEEPKFQAFTGKKYSLKR